MIKRFSLLLIVLILLAICLIVSGCVYKSEYIVPSEKSIASYQYIYVDPENPKLKYLIVNPSGDQEYEYTSLNDFIENIFSKHGFEPVHSLQDLSKQNLLKTAVVQWRKTDVIPHDFGYSIEVTVLVTDFVSKEIIYQGTGLWEGHEGAIKAALEGLEDAKAGLKGKKQDERWKPISK